MKYAKEIEFLIRNIEKIPEKYWEKTSGDRYEVVWFMDRQKPSIEADYSFDEERFGLTKDGRIIWGFDSGCSCPSPWSSADFGDENYHVKEWKQFEVEPKEAFDKDWEEDSYQKIRTIINDIKSKN